MRLSKDERQKIQPDFTEVQRRIYELLLRSPTTTVSFDTETDGLKPNKKQKMRPTMERTIIEYYERDNKCHITSVKNVASREVLRQVFGRDVADEYLDGRPAYWLGSDSTYLHINAGHKGYHTIYLAGKSFALPKTYFHTVIQNMKTAGNRLSRIVKEHKEKPQIKEIRI